MSTVLAVGLIFAGALITSAGIAYVLGALYRRDF